MAAPYFARLSHLISAHSLWLPAHVTLECKHFFSGAALYANGMICASLTPAGLGLKLPVDLRTQLLAEGAGRELRYFENAPVKKEYVLFPPDILGDDEKLRFFLAQSIAFVVEKLGGS
jgi:TfoX/Sxy family transcriptional regulator of competence genes